MKSPGAEKLGIHLKRLREERKLTLGAVEDLSAEHGQRVNKTYLFRVEKGKTVPTLKRLYVLSRVYRVKLSNLVGLIDPAPEPAKVADEPQVNSEDLSFEELRERGIEVEKAGDYPRAVAYFRAAGERARGEDPSPERDLRVATSRHDLAIALRHAGRWDLAREEAEEVFETWDLPEALRDKMRLNLAIIYRRLGHSTLAREFLLNLLDRREKLSEEIQALVHQEMGSQLLNSRPKEAAHHYKAALAIQKRTKNTSMVCALLVNVGLAEMNSSAFDQSLRSLEVALELGRKHQFSYSIAMAQWAIGRNLFLSGDLTRARVTLREANRSALDADYYDLLFANHYYLWRIAKQTGDASAVKTAEGSLRVYAPRLHEPLEELELYRKERK